MYFFPLRNVVKCTVYVCTMIYIYIYILYKPLFRKEQFQEVQVN